MLNLSNIEDRNRAIKAFKNNTEWLSNALEKKKDEHDYHLNVATHLRTFFVEGEEPALFYLLENFLSNNPRMIYMTDLPPEEEGFRNTYISAYICSVEKPKYDQAKKVSVRNFINTPVIIINSQQSEERITPMQVIKGFANADGGTHFGKEKKL